MATTEHQLTRAEVQAMRIRMAAAIQGWNVSELHRALPIEVEYETLRRAWAGERKSEVPYSLLKAIAEACGVEVAFVAGDNVTLPNRARGVSLRWISHSLTQPLVAA
jgi:hypothetical protein